ncbi:MAG: hypothetical protein H0T79_00420 [Deltaproteobacteria bacterium]|nr:hypothetical protein [Deltaproteobacteria bacterium]
MLKHLPAFLTHANKCAELRLRRIGVLDGALDEVSGFKRGLLVAEAYGGKALGGLISLVTLPIRILPFWPKKKRLTDIYLADPHVMAFRQLSAANTAEPDAQPQEP